MFEPKVRLSIEVSPGEWINTQVVIDGFTAMKVFRKIDHPRSNDMSDVMTCEMMSTIMQERVEVMEKRRQAASMLSEMLIHQLCEFMGRCDTVMGYSKEDLDRR